MRIFAITTFTLLLVTAILMTHSYMAMKEQGASSLEGEEHIETNSEQLNFSNEKIRKEEDSSRNNPTKIDSNASVSYEERHGMPTEFSNHIKEQTAANYTEEAVPTSASIKSVYEEKFRKLETTATEKVSDLFDLALNDYQTKKQNGENISYFYFFRTYYPKVTSLQREIETAFEAKYKALQNELEKHGYSTEKATKFKDQFEEKKSAQMRVLMAKVLEGF